MKTEVIKIKVGNKEILGKLKELKEKENYLWGEYNRLQEILREIEKKAKRSVDYALKIAGISLDEVREKITKELLGDVGYEELKQKLKSIKEEIARIRKEKEKLVTELAKEIYRKL